ncbi:MAG: proteinsorting protein [Candidatus Solibacter sp.]|nr:proteinsorting protein [Candidatus Solibacter sp.]
MRNYVKSTGCLCILLTAACATASTVVYDNGAPAFGGVNVTQVRGADDFVLSSSTTITGVRFFGDTLPTPANFPGSFGGTLSYAFYNNSSGTPGSLISSGSSSALTGVASGSFYIVDFNLASSVALAAGTYWLEVHEGATSSTDDGSPIFWAGLNSAPASNAMLSSSLNTVPNSDLNFELAFQLFSDPATSGAPEPSTFLLFAAPLAIAAFRLRRKVT